MIVEDVVLDSSKDIYSILLTIFLTFLLLVVLFFLKKGNRMKLNESKLKSVHVHKVSQFTNLVEFEFEGEKLLIVESSRNVQVLESELIDIHDKLSSG